MASIEININNKNYKSSSNNKNIVKTSTLKENSSNIEEVNLDDENQNVEEIETDNIDINNSEEEYNMTSSQTKDMIEKLESARDNYVKNYKELEEKYTDISNKEWYENGVLTANPTTNLPYTPEEYKSFLMRNGNITEEELKENEELTHQLDTYTKTYNEQFKKVVGVGYSEYKELKESYKSDLTILDNTISSLNSLAIEENYNEVLNTDSYKTYISSKKDMSFSELEQNYNEYNSKSIEITESAEASSKLYDTYNPMYIIEYAEQLAESEKFDITDVLEKQVQSYQYDLSEFYEYYKVMSEEEKNLYSYYFETEGREAAEKYFNDMKDTWNKKIAYNRFQEDVSSLDLTDEGAVKTNIANTLNVNIDGIGDGINQFMSGIANSITNNKEITIEEYKTMYYLAYLEQNSKILSTSYKVGTATGNMIPSITASTLTAIIAPEIAPKVGQTLIGISAFGNTKHSALIEGYSIPTSILYGVMSGGSEMLFESVGGIIGIADNPGGNALLRLLKEGAEEGAQSYIQAGIDAVILGKEINLDEITDDAKESFLIGVLVAAESNVYSKGLTDSISFIQNGEKITISVSELLDMYKEEFSNEKLGIIDPNVQFLDSKISEINVKFDSFIESLGNNFEKIKYKVQVSNELKDFAKRLSDNGYSPLEILAEYYNTGNINVIPKNMRSSGEFLKNVSKNQLETFLTSKISAEEYNSKFEINQDSKTQLISNNLKIMGIKSNLKNVIATINYKYNGRGIETLERYLITDNSSLITRDNNCRSYVTSLSKNDLTEALNVIISEENAHPQFNIKNDLSPQQAINTYNNLIDFINKSSDNKNGGYTYREYIQYVNECKKSNTTYFVNNQYLNIESQLEQLKNQFYYSKKYLSLKTKQDIYDYFGTFSSYQYDLVREKLKSISSLSDNPITGADLEKIKDINFIDYLYSTNSNDANKYLNSGVSNNSDISWHNKNIIMEYLKSDSIQGEFISKLTVKEALAIYEYTAGSGTIQRYLAGKPISNSFRIKDKVVLDNIVSGLDSAIIKYGGTKDNMILYRGDSFKNLSLWKNMNVQNYSDLCSYVGKTIESTTYMSTGVSKSGSFDGEIEWIIRAPKGTKGVYVNDISDYFYETNEYEYVVARNSKYRIDKVYQKYDSSTKKMKTYIEAKIVG